MDGSGAMVRFRETRGLACVVHVRNILEYRRVSDEPAASSALSLSFFLSVSLVAYNAGRSRNKILLKLIQTLGHVCNKSRRRTRWRRGSVENMVVVR